MGRARESQQINCSGRRSAQLVEEKKLVIRRYENALASLDVARVFSSCGVRAGRHGL